jgi:hypothetical protein
MERAFNFDDEIRRQAFSRQWNLCACCGENLFHLWDEGHHVIPNQTGDPHDPADAFLRSAENCVILCQACHTRVHENGRTRTGAVAPAEYYPFSHGKLVAQHHVWVYRINAEWQRITSRRTR